MLYFSAKLHFLKIDLQEFLIFPGKKCERYNFCKIHCNYFELYFILCVIKRKPYPIESELMTRGQHQGGGGVGMMVEETFQFMANTETKQTHCIQQAAEKQDPSSCHHSSTDGGLRCESGLPPQRARQKGN